MDTLVQDRAELAGAVASDDLHRRRRNMWMAGGAAIAVALVAVAIAVGGGGGGGRHDNAVQPSSRTPGTANAPAQKDASGSGAVAAAPAVPSPAGGGVVSAVPHVTPRVVRTGDLDLSVKKGTVSHTLDRLTGIATLEGGYVADSRTSEGGSDPSGQVTLRVPVKRFDDAITEVSKLGSRQSLQTSGQDITSQYVDLSARINALKATRAAFLALLAKATTIGDTLAVQQRVTDVQMQIEQLQGQLNVLADQSAMSTLTVSVAEQGKPTAVAKQHKSGLAAAFDRSVRRFVHGLEAIIGVLGPILLVLLLAIALWLLGLLGLRSYRRLRSETS